MEGWTDNALKVFQRHRKDPTRNHPDQERMVKLNQVSQSVIVANPNSAICQLYHGENKLIFNEIMLRSTLC